MIPVRKLEWVWRAILSDPTTSLHQQTLAERLHLSLSTVNAALRVPRRAGAIDVTHSGIHLRDQHKLLTIWSVFRDLRADTVAELRLDASAEEIEGDMIPQARFSGASACKLHLGIAPANYDSVLVYLNPSDLPTLHKRFAVRRSMVRTASLVRPANLIVLRPDPYLPILVPPSQVYADLWQLPNWWATEFWKALGEGMQEHVNVLP